MLLALDEAPERCAVRLAWSAFRRRHQAIAKRGHTARRAQRQPVGSDGPPIQVLSAGVPEFTDEQWARIAPLVPPQHPPTGRPNKDHRTILAGMLWVVRTGAAWRDLPERFGPWQTVHSRYRRWRKAGIWQRIVAALTSDADAHDP